jgi:hypothetical protein
MNNILKDSKDRIPYDLRVNHEIIFSSHKNVYRKRIERRQRSLLEHLSFIDHFLDDGEVIFLVTTACSPVSLGERFWTGLNACSLKHSLLVFTDRRVFHVPVTKDHEYKGSIANFFYTDCESIQLRRTCLRVKYKNGKKEKFHHIAIREERKVKSLLKTLPLEGPVVRRKGRVHLCPCCTSELDEGVFICAKCNLEFRNMTEARKLFFLPGGGYFYTRHPFMGIADALVEAMLVVLIILSLLGKFEGIRYSQWGIGVFSFALAFEKFLTIYHSKSFIKEFIPKQKKFERIRGGETDTSKKTSCSEE